MIRTKQAHHFIIPTKMCLSIMKVYPCHSTWLPYVSLFGIKDRLGDVKHILPWTSHSIGCKEKINGQVQTCTEQWDIRAHTLLHQGYFKEIRGEVILGHCTDLRSLPLTRDFLWDSWDPLMLQSVHKTLGNSAAPSCLHRGVTLVHLSLHSRAV